MYTYEALDNGEIRLLSVARSDTAPHGLHLNLKKTKLDQAPSFAGLSYTSAIELGPEGSATAPREQQIFKIQCGDGILEAREDLFHLL